MVKNRLKIITFILSLFFISLLLHQSIAPAFATAGINETINFQGKVTNIDETNVTDGSYDMVFRLYKASSGGVAQWTETWNAANQVPVVDGVFRVALGSITSISSLDWNDDSWYLSVEFNGDGEMSTRVRLTSVPYALNAKSVAGLTVQDSSGAADTTGTLKVGNGKTLTFVDDFTTSGAFGLTLTTTATTNVTLPTTGTLASLAGNEEFTNKTIGSTGLTFSGATTDITTAGGEALVINGNAASTIQTSAGTITLQAAGTGTISTIQIGAGGSGSTTPDFFALDVKSDTGDPVGGFEGALYYNTFDNKFRCYQNTGWTDCIGSGTGGAFTSAGGVITKNTSTDQFHVSSDEAGDYAILIDTSVAPTVDIAQINNTGDGTVTDGVDGLAIDFTAASDAAVDTNAGAHITITDSGDSGDTISGLQITAGTATAGTQYGINIEGITGGGGTEYALVVGSGWDRGLSVASASTFTSTLDSQGTLTVGSSGNTFTFNPASGPVYAGTARPAKKIVLSPEYPGATLFADGTNNSGALSSDYTDSAATGSRATYYQFTSSTASPLQDYTIVVRFTLPSDFAAWMDGVDQAIILDYVTSNASTANCKIDTTLRLETLDTADASDSSLASTTWTTTAYDDSELTDCDAAGETCVMEIKLSALSPYTSRIGDITLNYYGKY